MHPEWYIARLGERDVYKRQVYKCGDQTKYEHYMSWNYVGNEVPQFHSPEFFGEMIFE